MTLNQLWTEAFAFHQHSPQDQTQDNAFGTCAQLISPASTLLFALLPMTSAAVVSDIQAGGSSSNSSSSRRGSGDHSKTAAASRAVRVLQRRRLAQKAAGGALRDPFPVSLLFMLASVMQVVSTLLRFLASEGKSNGNTKRTVIMAETLVKEGKLFDCLSSISSFLLRCVRTRQLSSQHRPAADGYPPFEDVLLAACQNVCFACTQVFTAMYLSRRPHEKNEQESVPARFVDTLCCLACEGLPADDEAAWEVAHMFQDDGVYNLTNNTPCGLLCCSAMQQLVHRIIPSAVKRGKDAQSELELLLCCHPELEHDYLLSVHIRTTFLWSCQESRSSLLGAVTCSAPGTEESADSETAEAYFIPRVGHHSLQQILALLCGGSGSARSGIGTALCASKSSIYTARIASVLLSLNHSDLDRSARAAMASAATLAVAAPREEIRNTPVWNLPDLLIHHLVTAGRHSVALTIRLLQGIQQGHTGCVCDFSHEDHYMIREYQRPGVSENCLPCYALAETITALLLQMLPGFHLGELQQETPQNLGELSPDMDTHYFPMTTCFELNLASPQLFSWTCRNQSRAKW